MKVTKTEERTLSGKKVNRYKCVTPKGAEATFLSYGATLLSLKVPNKNGIVEEVTLCYPNTIELQQNPGPYFGCIAGRVANRIKGGKFELENMNYDLCKYQLAVNNGPNTLHGGNEGFDKKIWYDTVLDSDETFTIQFMLISEDGDEGYPGTLTTMVTYTLSESYNGTIKLSLEYDAMTEDPTIINLTNHTYWNLSGNNTLKIYDHYLQLSCSKYLPVDSTQIPTGEILPVNDTLFDFTTTSGSGNGNNSSVYGVKLGERIPVIDGCGQPGIDHCFAIDNAHISKNKETIPMDMTPRLRPVARLTDPLSGRQLTVASTQPGVQVYTANWLSTDPSNHPYTQHNGICLETQHYPDSINRPHFPTVILSHVGRYRHLTTYTFTTVK